MGKVVEMFRLLFLWSGLGSLICLSGPEKDLGHWDTRQLTAKSVDWSVDSKDTAAALSYTRRQMNILHIAE